MSDFTETIPVDQRISAADLVVNPAPPHPDDVTAERDRRTNAGFMFGGKLYQFDPSSKARITGAATLAKFAVMNGAQPGDLRWFNPAADFTWIAADNSLNAMDAQTCSAFGDAASIHEQRHIFAARALKNMNPIPSDYTNPIYWP
jgi:hypothetical protein